MALVIFCVALVAAMRLRRSLRLGIGLCSGSGAPVCVRGRHQANVLA
jgi:hypothetical protein